MAGLDPTGNGATLPVFGDQHEVKLLVTDAGFTPAEAIKIATLNGAIYLGQQPTSAPSRPARMPT
jgi:imidazolonepropionase-like amidohydrolase